MENPLTRLMNITRAYSADSRDMPPLTRKRFAGLFCRAGVTECTALNKFKNKNRMNKKYNPARATFEIIARNVGHGPAVFPSSAVANVRRLAVRIESS
jgi:hypothetical protein